MSESETPFRVYTLDAEGKPECLTAYDSAALADGLLYWHRRGVTVRGIMYRLFDDLPGDWLLNPWEAVPPTAVGSGRLSSATREPTEEDDR